MEVVWRLMSEIEYLVLYDTKFPTEKASFCKKTHALVRATDWRDRTDERKRERERERVLNTSFINNFGHAT